MAEDRTSSRPITQPSSQPRNLPPNAIRRGQNTRGQQQQQQQQQQQPPWRSSLDLVWSYSRSQAFYAGNLGSSPSFTDSRWQGPTYESAIESGDNDGEDDDEDEHEDDDDDEDEEEDSDDDADINAGAFSQSTPWSDESPETRPTPRQPRAGRDRQRASHRRLRRIADDEEDDRERSRSRSRLPKDLGYGHAESNTRKASSAADAAALPNEHTNLLPARPNHYSATSTTVAAQRRISRSSASGVASSKRKASGVSLGGRKRPAAAFPRGTSTFKQTLFNCINALVGVGILSLPLALSYSSLTIGIPLFLCAGLLTSYTGKLLWKVMLLDSRLRTYADIGRYAFGEKAQVVIALLFGAELWAVSVALIILFGDSMYALVHSPKSAHFISALTAPMESWTPTAFKLLGFVLVLPTVFMPLRLLAPISVAGIMSTCAILVILFAEGCLKADAPGSLRSPSISLWPPESPQWTKLPLCFGLIMSGFAAHPVVPALVRDMKDPDVFPRMLNLSYIIATCIYLTMGIAGYVMFGRGVTDEVTRDLTSIDEYPPWLTKAAIWLIVIVPLTKFALASRPVMGIIEGVLGVEEQVQVVLETKSASTSGIQQEVTTVPADPLHPAESAYSLRDTEATPSPEPRRRFVVRQATRLLLTIAILLTSIMLPEFERLMAFLGAALACTTCVIGPVAAHLKVFANQMSRVRIAADIALLAIVATLGLVGTVWAFTPLAKR